MTPSNCRLTRARLHLTNQLLPESLLARPCHHARIAGSRHDPGTSLAGRLRGFGARREVRLFGSKGIAIGKNDFLRVHLYLTPFGLRARVTEHGGPHWVLRCATIDDLRRAALSALETDNNPPSALWIPEVEFLYHAWFINPSLPEGDQDREWVACFIVRALSPEEAKTWGDQLSQSRAERRGEPLLSSGVELLPQDTPRLPLVNVGAEASDEHIGW